MNATPVRILLMEDDPGDVELILEALRDAKITLAIDHVPNGEEGMVGSRTWRKAARKLWQSATTGMCTGTFFWIEVGSMSMCTILACLANSLILPVTRSSKRQPMARIRSALLMAMEKSASRTRPVAGRRPVASMTLMWRPPSSPPMIRIAFPILSSAKTLPHHGGGPRR